MNELTLRLKELPSDIGRTWRKIKNNASRMFDPFDRTLIADHYLHGQGIEIGALHKPLKVSKARVQYVDRMTVDDLRKHYPELNQLPLVPVDIVTDGETLRVIANESQDFVIANHFIEHCQNPIAAIENMLRVLKKGGIIYLTVPDKRYTFDVDRPVTTVNHLLRDYREGPQGSKYEHFKEWIQLVEKTPENDVAPAVERLIEMDYSIHFHVWTLNDMVHLLSVLQRDLGFAFEVELAVKKEVDVENIFILRKTA